jgi:hypothetical protein
MVLEIRLCEILFSLKSRYNSYVDAGGNIGKVSRLNKGGEWRINHEHQAIGL